MLYHNTRYWLSALSLLATPLAADTAPKVVTDIAPIHSLTARVMQGVGEPTLLVPPSASPHGYALKPSQATALQQSDLVIWVGPPLTPWLDASVDSLASDAHVMTLLEADGVRLLDYREGALFEAHEHDEHDHEDHASEDHHDDDHDKHDDHEEHAENKAHDDHDGHKDHDGHEGHDDHGDEHNHHDHDGADPHAWLDPQNAQLWLTAIAEELGELDPANAALYQQNAQAGAEEISQVSQDIEATFAATPPKAFLVLHDALHYFEATYDTEAVGAISIGDATAPSVARLRELENAVNDQGIVCILTEPQLSPRLAETLADASGAKTVEVDIHGANLTKGAGLYPALLLALAESLASCQK